MQRYVFVDKVYTCCCSIW